MKPFSLLIKPSSADCNLRCEYCFYLDHCELYPETKKHRMSDEVLEKMIASYMATPQPNYAFGWQGGEPTLMGVDFFKKVTALQKKYGRPGCSVSNGLQTNATLITDEFAKHLAEYNFLCGVSMDGPEDIHNNYRKNASGRGSHADVWRGIECLRRHNVEFNILVLVSASNVGKAKQVYNYLVDNGFYFHQYIPCVEFNGKGEPYPFTISAEQWGTFLCELYDEWYKRDTRKVSIRLFDSMLNFMVDNVYNICHMGRNCCQYFVVEFNGDIYPCDFFVQDDLKIGNVQKTTWGEALESPTYKAFGAQKPEWNEVCKKCDHLALCSGDCLKHRVTRNGNPETLSWLCSGWKQFFGHSHEGFDTLADHIRREREQARRMSQPAAPSNAQFASVGRNDPCPCGSGKKFKKCHGNG